MQGKYNLVATIGLVFIGVFAVYASFHMPHHARGFLYSPGLLPLVVGLVIIGLASTQAILLIREVQIKREGGHETTGNTKEDFIRVLVTVLLIAAYIILLHFRVDYILATSLFLLATTFYYSMTYTRKKILTNIIVSIGFPIIIYYVFTTQFLIPLP